MLKKELHQSSNLSMADIKTFDLSDKLLNIGDVFTPLQWGEFAIRTFNLFEKWIDGATIFDPTMGIGNLLKAFITYGISQGYSIESLPIKNLFGNELNTYYYLQAISLFKEAYKVDMTTNFTNEDFLRLQPTQYDYIIGNPPWQNFVDLPESYKKQIKSYFFAFDLVSNSQSLLLGGSRIDIAALIIQIAMKDFLRPDGEAVMFVPLSLFLNDGANKNFRTYCIDDTSYSINSIFDFNDIEAFEGVATRYGLTYFTRNRKTSFPIPYYRNEKNTWIEYKAKPVFHETDPLSIIPIDQVDDLVAIKPIIIKKESTPRQGINTCGANDIFFFNNLTTYNDELVKVSNSFNKDILLPKQFIYPLITAKEFRSEAKIPSKWVLLPYNNNGKPLDWKEIQLYPELQYYLEEHKHILQNRKGVMLNAILNRGLWWAMLGVGEYNFFPYKVVWEAYGKTSFSPCIFDGIWQANQSLQAFIPVKNLLEAQRIKTELSNTDVEKYLLSLKMEGTMNWAQPGKIKKLISFEDQRIELFPS